jgi:kynurenine formamidase
MPLIDLSRDITHKMPRLPNHPMVIISDFTTHDEKREADGYVFSSAVTSLNMGDHSGTHVDAPKHFDEKPGAASIDEMPLETFSPRRSASTSRTSR